MPKVTFVVGYCGSGKSHLAKRLSKKGAFVFDEGFLKSKQDHKTLIKLIKSGIDCVVVEIAYCQPKYRSKILKELAKRVPGVDISWMYFQKDLVGSNNNCDKRDGGKRNPKAHRKINKYLRKVYEIPPGATPIKVVRI